MLSSASFPDLKADYILAGEENFSEPPEGFETIDRFSPLKLLLLKRTLASEKHLILRRDSIETPADYKGEYFNLLEMKADSLRGKYLRIDLDFTFKSKALPYIGAVSVQVFDKANNTIVYRAIDLDQLKSFWDGRKHNFHHSMVLEEVPSGAERLIIYSWDKHLQPYELSDGSVSISSVE